MVTQNSWRGFRSMAAAGVLLALAAPTLAFAQQTTQQSGATPPTPQGPVLLLTMDQAVTMGLESNLGLKAERLNVDIAAHSIAIARSAFLPQTSFGISRNTASSPAQRFADGTTAVTSSNRINGSGSVSQNIRWFGGQYSVGYTGNRNFSGGGGSTFNPALGSQFRVDFVQPLWRDLKLDGTRAQLETTERRRVITDVQVQQRVVTTEANIRFAYLNLIAAIEGRKVAQQNMDIAQQTLTNSTARVAVGQSPEIEIVQARSEVARQQEALLLSEARISTTEDDLRALILDRERPDYWTVRLQPADEIKVSPPTIDLDAAVKTALANRLDLTIERRNIELTDLAIRLDTNNKRPTVDFVVNYSASGSGGRFIGEGIGSDIGFGGVLNDALGAAYPNWTLGVQVGYPLGRSSAEASLAQNRVQRRQQDLLLQDLELQAVFDVRDAARQVQNSYQRVLASQAALEASIQQYAAEEKRFAVGIATTLDLQFRQGQLAQARITNLNATIQYNAALITFDRVQKTR